MSKVNEAQPSAVPSDESQVTSELNAVPKFAVGDRVLFADERGSPQRSYVTAIVPIGNYSATELGYAIRGDHGDYVRVASDITLDTESSEASNNPNDTVASSLQHESKSSPSLSTEAAREIAEKIGAEAIKGEWDTWWFDTPTAASIILPYLASGESERRVWDDAITVVKDLLPELEKEYEIEKPMGFIGASYELGQTKDVIELLEQARDRSASPDAAWACVWEEDNEGVWQTSCGNAWQFTDGGVSDNGVSYCPYCGKSISELAAPPDEVGGGVEADDDLNVGVYIDQD